MGSGYIRCRDTLTVPWAKHSPLLRVRSRKLKTWDLLSSERGPPSALGRWGAVPSIQTHLQSYLGLGSLLAFTLQVEPVTMGSLCPNGGGYQLGGNISSSLIPRAPSCECLGEMSEEADDLGTRGDSRRG